jgi:hypothetical protein
MKKLLLLPLLFSFLWSFGQQPYVNNKNYGNEFYRGKFDSSLRVPVVSSPQMFTNLIGPGFIVYNTTDSSLYTFDGTDWHKVGTGGSGGIAYTVSSPLLLTGANIHFDSSKYWGTTGNISNSLLSLGVTSGTGTYTLSSGGNKVAYVSGSSWSINVPIVASGGIPQGAIDMSSGKGIYLYRNNADTLPAVLIQQQSTTGKYIENLSAPSGIVKVTFDTAGNEILKGDLVFNPPLSLTGTDTVLGFNTSGQVVKLGVFSSASGLQKDTSVTQTYFTDTAVFQGDSYTFGLHASSPKARFTTLTARLLGFVEKNEGVSGALLQTNTPAIIAMTPAYNSHYAMLNFEFGTNDIIQINDTAGYRAAYDSVLNDAINVKGWPASKICIQDAAYLQSFPGYIPQGLNYAIVCQSVAKHYSIHYCSIYYPVQAFGSNYGLNYSDFLHPNDTGYALIAFNLSAEMRGKTRLNGALYTFDKSIEFDTVYLRNLRQDTLLNALLGLTKDGIVNKISPLNFIRNSVTPTPGEINITGAITTGNSIVENGGAGSGIFAQQGFVAAGDANGQAIGGNPLSYTNTYIAYGNGVGGYVGVDDPTGVNAFTDLNLNTNVGGSVITNKLNVTSLLNVTGFLNNRANPIGMYSDGNNAFNFQNPTSGFLQGSLGFPAGSSTFTLYSGGGLFGSGNKTTEISQFSANFYELLYSVGTATGYGEFNGANDISGHLFLSGIGGSTATQYTDEGFASSTGANGLSINTTTNSDILLSTNNTAGNGSLFDVKISKNHNLIVVNNDSIGGNLNITGSVTTGGALFVSGNITIPQGSGINVGTSGGILSAGISNLPAGLITGSLQVNGTTELFTNQSTSNADSGAAFHGGAVVSTAPALKVGDTAALIATHSYVLSHSGTTIGNGWGWSLISGLGVTDSTKVLTRLDSNQLKGYVTPTALTVNIADSANVLRNILFKNGGNAFGAASTIGAADNNVFSLIQNNTSRLVFATSGVNQFTGQVTSTINFVASGGFMTGSINLSSSSGLSFSSPTNGMLLPTATGIVVSENRSDTNAALKILDTTSLYQLKIVGRNNANEVTIDTNAVINVLGNPLLTFTYKAVTGTGSQSVTLPARALIQEILIIPTSGETISVGTTSGGTDISPATAYTAGSRNIVDKRASFGASQQIFFSGAAVGSVIYEVLYTITPF